MFVAEDWDTWRAEVAFAESLVEIEEYARHNGHADFLRERMYGRVGQ